MMKEFNTKYKAHFFILQNNYENVMKLPKIKKISLNFGFRHKQPRAIHFLAANFILTSLTQNQGRYHKSRKSSVLLKVRQGDFVSCSVVLLNSNTKSFLLYFTDLLNNYSELALKKKNVKNNNLLFEFPDLFIMKQFEFFFDFLVNLPKLKVTVALNCGNTRETQNVLNICGFNLLH